MITRPPLHLSNDKDTIISCCTPRGSGAIALIRLAGQDAVVIASQLARLSSGKTLTEFPTHTIHHGHVIDPSNNDSMIDEVLFLLMRGPRTFTGLDTVEITCHNNQFIIENIIQCAIKQGARPAAQGEFTKRAYLEGKIDLVQAEAINDIIHAQSESGVKQALSQLAGSLSHIMASLENNLIELLSLLESSFEFLEEEQQDINLRSMVEAKLSEIRKIIFTTKEAFTHQKHIRDGIRIALIGSVNAGKSTLFNELVKQNRAIVSSLAGTTRDSIESSRYVNGSFWLFIDTAGLRESKDLIEQEGIKRSLDEAKKADVIILVYDGSRPLSDQEREAYSFVKNSFAEKIIEVISKGDQLQESPSSLGIKSEAAIIVSGHTHEGIGNLEQILTRTISDLMRTFNAPFLINERQYAILTKMDTKLNFIANSYSKNIEYEVMAYHLKDLIENISELTGKNISERILDTVFSTFCVGK